MLQAPWRERLDSEALGETIDMHGYVAWRSRVSEITLETKRGIDQPRVSFDEADGREIRMERE
jgi:hypothetical protein